ncbi:MAG: transcriptional regulator [Acidimicrobiales bacterium]|nr:transcriptional regulator [Acidimicrobiales bacterium]
MTILLWLLGGIVLGALAERVIPRRADAPGDEQAPRRRRSRKRIIGFSALFIVVLLIAVTIGGYLWASSIFDKIQKVDVSAQLSHGSGTNYLLVGSDNGRTSADQRAGVAGARSDTIMILRVVGGKAQMLSLNRDLFVTNPATGQKGRLNATYNSGPSNLIKAVTEDFGIPIDRYIEIDFVSFGGLVDSFGGIDVNFAHPAFDLASGLDVKTAGTVHLDGTQALAYVRSRHYYEMIDGRPTAEGGLPDVNRTMRQQTFLRAIMAKAGAKRNPFTLASAAKSMTNGLRVDNHMSLADAIRFAWRMGKLNPKTVQLPVTPRTTTGGADVLDLGPGADAILSQFR